MTNTQLPICIPGQMSPRACREADPFTKIPQVSTQNAAPTINCLRHQAPAGYRYVSYNGRCVLQNRATGQIFPPTSTTTGNVQALTAGSVASGVAGWVGQNTILAIAIVGVAMYAIGKNTK